MAIVVEEVQAAGTNGTGITLSLAVAPNEGDLLLAFMSTHHTDAWAIPNLPAGFNERFLTESTWRYIKCGFKFAGASEGTDFSFTLSGGNHKVNACLYRISGVAASPIRQHAIVHETNDVASISAAFTSATQASALAIGYYHSHNPGSTADKTWSTGWTDEVEFGADSTEEKSTARKITDGTTMNTTVTITGTTNQRQSLALVELVPVDGGVNVGSTVTATDGDLDVATGDPSFTGSVSQITIHMQTSGGGEFDMQLPIGSLSTNTNPTFDMPDFRQVAFETDWCPYDTDSYILEVIVTSDDPGDVPYTVPLNRNLPQGYAVVELGTVSTDVGSMFYGVVAPETVPPAGSQVVYPTANNTAVTDTGLLTTDQNGGFINCWVWRSDTSEIEFTQVYIPGQLRVRITSNPATLEPSTQYVATVANAPSVITSGLVYGPASKPYPVTINEATLTSVTFTTPSNLPAGSPVDFEFTV